MKKKRLLRAALALAVCMAGGLWPSEAKGQGWTASEAAAGDYYLYNVGAEAFLTNGSSWGTHAALSNVGFVVNLTKVSNNVFTIGTNSKYSGKYFTDNGYVDTGTATSWTFEAVSGLSNTYKLKTSSGSYAFAAAGKYNVEIGTDPGSNMGYWKLVTAANRADGSAASSSNPIDWSFKITNARFDSNTSGWSGDCTRGGQASGTNGNVGSYDNFNPCVERYHATTNVYQTISVPDGHYRVKCQGFYRADNGSTHSSVLYANEEATDLAIFNAQNQGTAADMNGASTAFSAGQYVNSVDVKVSGGSLTIGVKTDDTNNWTIFDNFQIFYLGGITVDDLSAGDDCTNLFITNPGFEDNAAVVNLSSTNLTGVTGWTLATADNTNDIGTRAYSNATFASLNGVGDYCFNSYWEGKPLTQEIGPLPAGTYELSALVATGNASSAGTVFLNAGDARSTGFVRKSAHANFYGRERLVFTLTSDQKVTIGIRGGSDIAGGATKGEWVDNGYWWYKCDDFRLTYLGEPTQANLFSQLSSLRDQCEPWTSGDEYATRYATYSDYTASNSIAELTEAINYLTNEYEKYALEKATMNHPFDLQAIKNADYSNGQNNWSTTNNQTGGGSYTIGSDGSQSNYFNSSFNSWMRHSTVYQEGIVLDEGIYRLSARMKGSPKDDESTYMYATDGAVAHWESPVFKGTVFYGYLTTKEAASWSTVETYITLDAPATIRVGVLSWGNNWNGGNGGAFAVDDWKLEKIDYAVITKNGVATVVGAAPLSAINEALTEEVGAINLIKATGLSSATISVDNNPNLLIFANDGQVSLSQNVVVDGTCASLQLVKGHPFVNPTSFTATSASYTVSDNDLAGNKFATLMLPFAVASVTDAYVLDQGVDLIGGVLKGTKVTSIEANKPVLVTKTGSYSGSGVTVPAVAAGQTFTNGELVGVYQNTSAPQNSYVLQNHTSGEGVAFYIVGSKKPQVGSFRAYIKPQATNVKAITVAFDADGIETMDNGQWTMDNAEIFNLAGQRLSKPQRGVNIINGKKVVVK